MISEEVTESQKLSHLLDILWRLGSTDSLELIEPGSDSSVGKVKSQIGDFAAAKNAFL
jgi:hypothetical protein